MRLDNRVANLIQILCFKVFSNEFIIDTQYNVFLIFLNLFLRIH